MVEATRCIEVQLTKCLQELYGMLLFIRFVFTPWRCLFPTNKGPPPQDHAHSAQNEIHYGVLLG